MTFQGYVILTYPLSPFFVTQCSRTGLFIPVPTQEDVPNVTQQDETLL